MNGTGYIYVSQGKHGGNHPTIVAGLQKKDQNGNTKSPEVWHLVVTQIS